MTAPFPVGASESHVTHRASHGPQNVSSFRLPLVDPLWVRESWNGEDAVRWLMRGNARHQCGEHQFVLHDHPAVSIEGLDPSVILVSCVDARLRDARHVFDAPLGLCMNARIPGAISSNDVCGTVEFTLMNCPNVRAIVFMGHTKCGMLGKAIHYSGAMGQDYVRPSDGCDHAHRFIVDVAGSLDAMHTDPRLAEARADGDYAQIERLALNYKLHRSIERLRHEVPLVRDFERRHGLVVVGGTYDMATKEFRLLGSDVCSLSSDIAHPICVSTEARTSVPS